MSVVPNHIFLKWLADRLVNVYGESPNTDFVTKLYDLADKMRQEAENRE